MGEYAPEKRKVPVTATIDPGQRRELTALARREDRSVSSIVRLALAGYLKEKP